MLEYSRSVVALAVGLILCAASCQSGSRPPKPAPKVETDAHKDHDHDHDGLLFHDANERYHMRVEIDAAKKEVEARVLDENAKEPAPLAADALTLTIKNGKPHQVALKAQRTEGKKETAIFRGTDERFTEKLDPAKIEISVDILKKNYIFTLDTDHGKKK